MALDPKKIDLDHRGLFQSTALAKNETGLKVVAVEFTQLFDGQRQVIDLPFFCRIFATRDSAEWCFAFEPSNLRRPYPMQADHETARTPEGSVLENMAALA